MKLVAQAPNWSKLMECLDDVIVIVPEQNSYKARLLIISSAVIVFLVFPMNKVQSSSDNFENTEGLNHNDF